MDWLAERAKRIKPSATLAVTARANALKAQGVDVIGFGAGEPDFDTPDPIKEAAWKALREGFTKYTPVGGIDALKDAIIERFKQDSGISYDRKQILVSCGAKHSLYNLFMAVLNPGDEVLIPAPCWVSYPDMVQLADAVPVLIPSTEKDGFRIKPEVLKSRITKKTRALIINSPSNPTGSAYTENELRALAEPAVEAGLLIISDEIYGKLVYDGFRFVSVGSLSEKIRKSAVIVDGVSKSYSMTGWRIGYAAGPAEVISAMTNIQSQSTSNPTSFAQKGALEALSGPQDFVGKMREEFSRRRDYIVGRLNAMPGVTCSKPQGAFYVFPNVATHFGKSDQGKKLLGSNDLATYLLEKAHVAVVAGVEFGSDQHVRLSYATSMKQIEEGMNRIEAALKKLA
ncbi:MAG: pyridoxal phosphate-dependent aminotransferase [Proteobacteria bacterium]|nr:pyridoxal phosphate-dependent aminotransferase [Pseudomonadota bacterium]